MLKIIISAIISGTLITFTLMCIEYLIYKPHKTRYDKLKEKQQKLKRKLNKIDNELIKEFYKNIENF